MAKSTKANMSTGVQKAWVRISGRTGTNTSVNTYKVRNTAKGSIAGNTAE